MKTTFRILFLLLALAASAGSIVLFNNATDYLQKISESKVHKAEIAEILECKFGSGAYMIKILHDDGSHNYENAISKDYSYVYDIGDAVESYHFDGAWHVFQMSNTLGAISIFFFVVSFALFLWSQVANPKYKRGELLTVVQSKYFFIIFIWMALLTLSGGYYHLSHSEVFYKNAVKTQAQITGYKEKMCKRKDDGKTVSYPCFGRELQYEVGEKTFEKTDSFSSRKKGKIGTWVDIYYLKANPNSFRTRSSASERRGSKFFIGFAIVFLLFMLIAIRIKAQAVVSESSAG